MDGITSGSPLHRGLRIMAAAVLAASFTVGELQAQQTGRIVGTITVEDTGAPVADVSVYVEGTNRGALSDDAGRFVIAGLAPGSYVVVAERVGLASARQAVDMVAGSDAELRFTMGEAPVNVSQIVVTASRNATDRSRIAASVGVVDRDQLANTQPSHPSEIMGRVAGVWVNTTGGEGHMTAIRQPLTTNPVYLYLEDGIPTRSTGFFNHNALYEINVPQADRVEVMKGPATALYGSDAIGGVINVSTQRPTRVPRAEVSVEGGEHGYKRIMGSVSGITGGHGFSANLNVTDNDGWRSGTAYERQSGTVRWDRATESGWAIKGVAAFSNIDQQTAGTSALSRELYETQPTANLTPISFRKVQAVRLSLAVERSAGRGTLSLTPFYRYNVMDLLPNWSLTFDPAIWETRNQSFGVLAKYGMGFPSLNLTLTTGIDVDVSPGEHFETSIVPTRVDGIFTEYTDGPDIYDYDVTYRQVAPYAQAVLQPTRTLTITGGLRGDFMEFDYGTHLPAVQDGPHRRPDDAAPRFARVSPKLGVTYAPRSEIGVFSAYREGFRAPSEGQLFRQGAAVNTVDLEPVKVRSLEAGVRGLLAGRLAYEVSAYRMAKRDDILSFDRPDGNQENQNAGETLHKGVEAQVGLEVLSGLRLDVAYTYAKHTYETWRPDTETDYSGKEMEFAPSVIANTVLTWEIPGLAGSNVSLEWSRLGSYWEDAANENRYEGHDLLNARASLPLGDTGATLFARLHNVTDELYAERASYNAFRGEELAPGLPRTFYLGLRVGRGF